jgi:hypothetical protein
MFRSSDEASRSSDVGAGCVHHCFKESGACRACRRGATPQAQPAVDGERVSDRSQMFGLALKRRDRPLTCSESDPTGSPVGHNMYCFQIFAAFEHGRDLMRWWPQSVEHNRLDSGPQAVKNCRHIFDRWIDEKNLRDALHRALLGDLRIQ